MDNLQNYIKPELLVIVPVIYIIGLIIKNTEKIKDKYIPAILGIVSVLLSLLYILGTGGISVMGVFTAITQGILVVGVAVYVNQLFKQLKE